MWVASKPGYQVRQELLDAIRNRAILHGRFELSGGQISNFYIDLRQVTMHGPTARLIGQLTLELLRDLDFDAVGGLTLGADPFANAIMHQALLLGLELDVFVVRKERKEHGTKAYVEGPSTKGRKVVVVDDTSTTGASTLRAVEAVEKEGAQVVAVVFIVDRGGSTAIIARDIPCFSLFTQADLGLN